MLYCGFTFFNELDLLEIMLQELWDVVDRFILVESTRTFSGQEKELHYATNKYRFQQWWPKLHHVIVHDMPLGVDSWTRERHQRNAIGWGLVGCRPSDRVLLCDADEIADPKLVADCKPSMHEVVRFQMKHYIGYFDCRWNDETSWARIMTYEHLNFLGGPEIAMKNTHPDRILYQAGWHFSYMGGEDHVIEKLGAYSHQEYNTPPYTTPGYFKQCLLTGVDPLHGDSGVKPIDSLAELPVTVVRNKARYKDYFLRP